MLPRLICPGLGQCGHQFRSPLPLGLPEFIYFYHRNGGSSPLIRPNQPRELGVIVQIFPGRKKIRPLISSPFREERQRRGKKKFVPIWLHSQQMWGRRIRFKQPEIAFQPFFLAVPPPLTPAFRMVGGSVPFFVPFTQIHTNCSRTYLFTHASFSNVLALDFFFLRERNLQKKSKIPLTSCLFVWEG